MTVMDNEYEYDCYEGTVKYFLAIAIGSICCFSFVFLPISLTVVTTILTIRALIVITKTIIKFHIQAILETYMASIRIVSYIIIEPILPNSATTLRFRSFQFCRRIWIKLLPIWCLNEESSSSSSSTSLQQQQEDPTIYVYDPRGRTFQSFDPNWKPAIGSIKRKRAKQQLTKRYPHIATTTRRNLCNTYKTYSNSMEKESENHLILARTLNHSTTTTLITSPTTTSPSTAATATTSCWQTPQRTPTTSFHDMTTSSFPHTKISFSPCSSTCSRSRSSSNFTLSPSSPTITSTTTKGRRIPALVGDDDVYDDDSDTASSSSSSRTALGSHDGTVLDFSRVYMD